MLGSSGLGKSSLINTICNAAIIEQRQPATKETVGLPKTLDIQSHPVGN